MYSDTYFLQDAGPIVVNEKTLHSVIIAGSAFLLVLNLFVTFVGSKYFNTSLICQGGILGGFMGWYVGDAIGDSIGKRSPILNFLTAIGFALFVAFFTCMLRPFMKFLFGAALGVQIGSVLNVVWLHHVSTPVNRPNPNTLGYIIMGVLGLLLGVGAIVFSRKSQIILTATVGAYWVVQSIGNFIGNFPPMFYPYPNDAPAHVSMTFYNYIGGWIVLSFLGIFVQAHLTPNPPTELDDLQMEKDYQKQTAYTQLV